MSRRKKWGSPSTAWAWKKAQAIRAKWYCTDGKTHKPRALGEYFAYIRPDNGQPLLDPVFQSPDTKDASTDEPDGPRTLPSCPECGRRTRVEDPQGLRDLLALARPGKPLRVDVTTATLLD